MKIERLNPAGAHALPELITQAVVVDELSLVHLSGQVAWDENGELVGPGSHGDQVGQIVRNIDTVLAGVGTSRDHLLKETIFVVDYRPELLEEILQPLRAGAAAPPASTLVGVQALFAPGYLVEVEVVAALPATRAGVRR